MLIKLRDLSETSQQTRLSTSPSTRSVWSPISQFKRDNPCPRASRALKTSQPRLNTISHLAHPKISTAILSPPARLKFRPSWCLQLLTRLLRGKCSKFFCLIRRCNRLSNPQFLRLWLQWQLIWHLLNKLSMWVLLRLTIKGLIQHLQCRPRCKSRHLRRHLWLAKSPSKPRSPLLEQILLRHPSKRPPACSKMAHLSHQFNKLLLKQIRLQDFRLPSITILMRPPHNKGLSLQCVLGKTATITSTSRRTSTRLLFWTYNYLMASS